MTTEHHNVRQHILDTGKTIILSKGFAGVGLNEILTAAGVPKGSFYHYFKSKELFGVALLEDHVEQYLAQIERLLNQQGQNAAQSLLDYWASWEDGSAGYSDCSCLVVKLGSEVADMSEAMRTALLDGTNRIVARLADGIVQAVAEGSLPPTADAAHTALALYQMWLGAAMLTKLRREPSALRAAWRATVATLGLPPDTQPRH